MIGAAQPKHLRFASAAIAARIASLVTGLVAIPFLIRFLGGENFAAWAVLLACGGGFSLLQMGLLLPVVRFLAADAGPHSRAERGLFFSRIWVTMGIAFGVGAGVTLLVAEPLATWTHLPSTPLLRPQHALYFVFAMVALRSFAQTAIWAWTGQLRLERVAAISFAQSLVPNLAAVGAAWLTLRLDWTLVAFWLAHVVVAGVAFVWGRADCMPRFSRASLVPRKLRDLAVDGLGGELEALAHFVNYQFDKFIVAGLVGLWAVAPYEVANRAVAALRSAPVSGADAFLPLAMTHGAERESAWRWYVASLRLLVYGIFVFVLAPMTIAPVFLYAWTGEMGYVGRWVFCALAIGTAANLLSLPSASLAQSAGRRRIPARAALWMVLVNIPLSLLLVQKWDLVGAAIGTSVAMIAGAAVLTVDVHHAFGRKLTDTTRLIFGFWPLVAVCVVWGLAVFVTFDVWFSGLPRADRYARVHRWAPAIAAGMAYVGCLSCLVAVEVLRGRLSLEAWRTFRTASNDTNG